jgi:hypothetical protein
VVQAGGCGRGTGKGGAGSAGTGSTAGTAELGAGAVAQQQLGDSRQVGIMHAGTTIMGPCHAVFVVYGWWCCQNNQYWQP